MPHDTTALSAPRAVAHELRAASGRPRAATRSATAKLDIEVVDTLDGMRALEADWRRLEEEGAASFNFFQSFDWNMRWAERFITTPDCATPTILTGREKGRLVMLWPLMVECDGPFCVLKWLGDPFPQYGGALIAPDVDRAAWIDVAWRYMIEMPGIDAIALRKVREDDPVNARLAGSCAHTAEQRVGCFIEIGRYASHDDMLASLRSRRRQLRRKLRRNLEEKGPVEFRMAFDGPEFERIIRETMRLKRQWLADTGQVSKPVSDPRLDEILISFSGQGPDMPRVAAGVLTCNGEPAAYEIAFHYRRHHYLYIIAQEAAYVALSPSKVQVDEAQAWGIENGMKIFDLLPPEDRYKRDLSDETIEVFDYVRPTSAKGKIYVAYLVRLRPMLKALYLRYGAPLASRLRGHGATARTEDKSND